MQLQKLGLEIRKIGSLQNLYQDVDRMLKNYKIPINSVNIPIQTLTVAHSLQKMLNVEKYLCVSTLKNNAQLVQICIPEERMLVYQSIHCMYWNEMTPDYRQMVVAMILDDFRSVLDTTQS